MFFQIVCVGLLLVAMTSAQERCGFSPGVQGVCRDIRQCPRVVQDLQNRVKFPIICRMEGRYPVVCCPPNGSTGGPTNPLVDISEPPGSSNCGRPTTGSPLFGDVRIAESTFVIPEISHAVGGQLTQRGDWPWMALLGFREASGKIDWFCAGVLINNQWILTAAHCIDLRTVDVVRLGEYDYLDNNDGAAHVDFDIESPIRHPEYSTPQAYHDLALIRLRQRVNLQDNIQPVCLPWGTESNKNLEGETVTLTGWGDTLFGGKRSEVLLEVQVTVFPSGDCDKSYQNITDYKITWPRGIGSESICSGDRDGGKDACQGDSGGPIVSRDSRNRFTVAGIVSVGYGCGSADYPGLYVNLRRPEYLAWIRKVAF